MGLSFWTAAHFSVRPPKARRFQVARSRLRSSALGGDGAVQGGSECLEFGLDVWRGGVGYLGHVVVPGEGIVFILC